MQNMYGHPFDKIKQTIHDRDYVIYLPSKYLDHEVGIGDL